MRSYEELEANAYKKAEQIINDSKRKKKIMLRRSLGLTLGAAVIIGVGICANALKPPKKPTADSSSITAETTSSETPTAAETTAKASVQTVKTAPEPIRTTGTSTAASSAETTAHTRETVTAPAPVTGGAEYTSAEVRTVPMTTNNSFEAVTTARVTSANQTTQKTTSAAPTTAATTEKALTTTTTVPKYDLPPIAELPPQVVQDEALPPSLNELKLMNGMTYSNCFRCVSEEKIGSFLEELTVENQLGPYISPVETSVELYEIKYSNTDYRLAVKFQGSQVYHIYENTLYDQ